MITQGDEFDQSRFRRAQRLKPLEDTEVAFASPEDVIIMKLDFYRRGRSDKHLRDIAGILKISSGAIDIANIEAWARDLGLEEIWVVASRRAGGPGGY